MQRWVARLRWEGGCAGREAGMDSPGLAKGGGEKEHDQARGTRVRELEDRPNLKELESELSVSPNLALRGDPHPVWLVRGRRRCCI